MGFIAFAYEKNITGANLINTKKFFITINSLNKDANGLNKSLHITKK